MSFEVVDVSGTLRCFKIKPYASIINSYHGISQILFNSTAQRELLLKTGKFIKLYYDRENRQIGFEIVPTKQNSFGTISTSGALTISKFIHQYNLNIQTIIGKYEILEHGALFIIDLKNKLPFKKRKEI